MNFIERTLSTKIREFKTRTELKFSWTNKYFFNETGLNQSDYKFELVPDQTKI